MTIAPLPSLDALADLARRAGAAIEAVRASADWGITAKGDESPVTRADAAAEAVICEGLRAIAPGWPVVAEEAVAAGALPPVDRHFILVDPLDGTREFIAGNADYTVNIACIVDGAPVVGVVYLPARDTLYAGDAEGVWREDGTERLREAIATRQASEPLTVLASRSHGTPETDAFLAALPRHECVQAGSSLKFARLAEGTADLYPRFGPTMGWDTAAGHAVLIAAGGCVVTCDGAPLTYAASADGLRNPNFLAASSIDLARAVLYANPS